MITKLTINDPAKLPIKWWEKAECLKKIKTLEFKPGLNVLWGRNGSGKSSVLALLAKFFHAEQGRYTFISRESLSEFVPYGTKPIEVFGSATIEHDSQGVMYFNPDHRPGLVGGMAGFDYDFMDAAMGNIFVKGSCGELEMYQLNQCLAAIKDGKRIDVKFKHKKEESERQYLQEFLKGNIPDGQPTFLLDEPERSCDLPVQKALMNFLQKRATDVQIIVASHSVFAANIPGANYIEFSEGYLAKCRDVIEVEGLLYSIAANKKKKAEKKDE